MEINKNEDKIDYHWCYFLATFLDILGQKAVFKKLYEISYLNELDDEKTNEISENLVYMEKLRENLKAYFNLYTREEQPKISVEETVKDQFDQMRKAEIHFQYFSDNIIAFVPLEFRSFYSVTINGVWAVLGACGSVILGSLAVEHAVRGGIDICWGTRLKSGEIYGPALNRAYTLESKVAQYPRIVIGDGVRNYLNSLSNKNKQHPAQTQIDIEACKRMADRCLKLISKDKDDRLILDYLGSGFLELNKELPEYFKLYDLSKKFVCDSLAKWRQKEDCKIALKYKYLIEYFQSKSGLIEEARKALQAN